MKPIRNQCVASPTGHILLLLLVIATLLAWSGPASAYPDRPIRLIVPFIAGSPVDALARIVAERMSRRIGQPVVIENQSGAGGTLGTRAAANAAPDGHTLLFALNSHAYGLYTNPGYDPVASFLAIATVATWSHVLVVRPAFPAHTVRDLIAYAKANPGTVMFGFGINTPPQVLGETLKIVSGADIRSIPYRGGAQAVGDMLGGRIDMNFGATATLLPLIRDNRLRAIAYTGASRSPDLPDVPTVAEAGLPALAFDPDAWTAVLAPAGTPLDVASRLNAVINECLRSGDLQGELAQRGYQPRIMSLSESAAFLAAEMHRWPPIVKAAGLRAE